MVLGTTFVTTSKNWRWTQLIGVLAVLSITFLIWVGPPAVFLSSSFGVLGSVILFFLGVRKPDRYPGMAWIGSFFLGHLILLGVAWSLNTLFLSPLPEGKLEIPKIAETYLDPDGRFELKGPENWIYTPLQSLDGYGVSLQPSDQSQYMGSSEVQIWIRELEDEPESTDEFLQKMASSMAGSDREKGQKHYEFELNSSETLGGDKSIFSVLDVKRFWVPLRQVTLFGIKKKRYFCSISASGLKSHSTLSKIFCLGLFETLKPQPVSKE